MERRKFLGTTAALGSAAVVGRADAAPADPDVETDDGPEPPSVPMDRLDGRWSLDPDRSGTFSDSTMGITSTGTTVAYVDEALSEELRRETLGSDVDDMRIYFATRIDYDPAVDDLPFGLGRGVVLNATRSNARERFESEMANSGLEGIERRDTGSLQVDGGPEADLFVYDATYPFDGFEFEAGGTTVTVDGDAVAVEGLLAVWYSRQAGSALVTGAINPAENYRRSVERELTRAVELTLDIDLGLTPGSYREESKDLMRAVD